MDPNPSQHWNATSGWTNGLRRPAVVCTIVKTIGSAPQQIGVKMWVTAGEFYGTVGGGEFERQVIEWARRLLDDAQPAAQLKEYVLCKEMGQCCGGRVDVFFEPVFPRKAVHLFGGGHVGRATASVLSQMPMGVVVIDPRAEWARPEGLPSDVRVVLSDPIDYAKSRDWGPGDAVCIFTHSHDMDLQLVRYFFELPVGYLGLIGSEHKAEVFKARLSSSKKTSDEIEDFWGEKVHCPIGIPLESKNPKVIAVSIAAELLKEWALKDENVDLKIDVEKKTVAPESGSSGLVPIQVGSRRA